MSRAAGKAEPFVKRGAKSKAVSGVTLVGGKGAHAGILVLGMHRSGTSAITRVMNLLGVDLSNRLMVAQPGVNEKGFWEHLDAVAIHERLLHWHGSNWSDVNTLPSIDPSRGVGQEAMEDVRRLIRNDFGHAVLWALKDPRTSLFVPVWLRAMSAENVQPKFVISVRHPEEVVASLEKRDGLTRGHALLLWGRYVSEAVKASTGFPRAVCDYSELLRDWRGQVGRVAAALALTWPRPVDDAAAEVDAFLTEDERHHRTTETDLPASDALFCSVKKMYALLLAIAQGRDEWEPLLQACTEFEVLGNGLAPYLSDLLKQVWMHAERADYAEGSLAREATLRAELNGKNELIAVLENMTSELTARAESLEELRGELDLRINSTESGEELLRSEVRARDGLIDTLQQVIAEKETRLLAASEQKRQLEAWLAELRLHAGNLESRIQEADVALAAAIARGEALSAQGAKEELLVASLEQWLAEKGKRLDDAEMKLHSLEDSRIHATSLESRSAEQEKQIASLEAALGAARNHAKSLEGEYAEMENKIASIEAALVAARTHAKDLQSEYAGKERKIASLEAELASTRMHIGKLESEHAEKDRRMNEMLSSRSWRYTSMFRRQKI